MGFPCQHFTLHLSMDFRGFLFMALWEIKLHGSYGSGVLGFRVSMGVLWVRFRSLEQKGLGCGI